MFFLLFFFQISAYFTEDIKFLTEERQQKRFGLGRMTKRTVGPEREVKEKYLEKIKKLRPLIHLHIKN